MKLVLLFTASLLICSSGLSQQKHVGIGTQSPVALLHVADSSVIFTATGQPAMIPGGPPISDAGRRMMWYADKAAFRVGYVSSNQWNKNNIGDYSFATGSNTMASGYLSTALGSGTIASGSYTTAFGTGSIASGGNATALGIGTIASGIHSTAMGAFTIASGLNAAAMGYGTHAKSGFETAIGTYNTNYTPVDSLGWDAADRMFVVGNGGSSITRSDALVILKNGRVGIGTSTPALLFQVAKNTTYQTGNSYGIAVTNASNTNLRLNLGYDAAVNGAVIQASEEGVSFIKNLLLNPNGGNVGIGVNSPAAKLSISTDGIELTGGASGNGLRTNAGTLGNMPGNELSLANIGFKGTNNCSLGIRAYRRSSGADWQSTALVLGLDVDHTVRASPGYITLSANGHVGVGVLDPLARLHVTDSSVLFSATGDVPSNPGNPSVSGGGRRMMWYPDKAAFRAGFVIDNKWNRDSIGKYSVVLGSNGTASGNHAFSAGASNVASGLASIAMGANSYATGTESVAIGDAVIASNYFAVALGSVTLASGYNATAIGGNTIASGDYSTAMGINAVAEGDASSAFGHATIASGTNSTALGYYTSASGSHAVAMGQNTNASGNSSFAMGQNTNASGDISTALGAYTIAQGLYSTSLGLGTIASGMGSTAIGEGTVASGTSSTAMGLSTTASGASSTAMGQSSNSIGYGSLAGGHGGNATADFSIAIGESVFANAWASTTLGRLNDPIVTSPTTSWILSEPLLIVGNGTGPMDKKNALVILKNGNTGIGTNNPIAKLEVNGNLRFTSVDCINNFCPSNSAIRLTPNFHINALSDNALYVNWDNGASTPGNLNFVLGNGSTAGVFWINYAGNGWMAGTLNQASDLRLKKDVTPLQHSLEKITQLNGYTYYWKSAQADDALQTGVIAQEVQQLFPSLVKEDVEGMLSVNYSGLIPVLIESIKEQQIQLRDQQQQIDDLKKLVLEFVAKN